MIVNDPPATDPMVNLKPNQSPLFFVLYHIHIVLIIITMYNYEL